MHNFSRNLKILMVHPHDISEQSEPWTVRIVNIAERLTQRGCEVKLIYFSFNGKADNIQKLQNDLECISLNRTCGILRYIQKIIKLSKYVQWADVVHIQKCFHYATIPVIFACYMKRKPVHYDWDDWETQIYHYGKPASRLIGIFMYLIERILPKVVDSISASSDKLMELSLHYGMRKDRLVKASVGADLNTFHPHNNADIIKNRFNIKNPIILYLGQLHGAQYAELFIEAAGIISHSYPHTDVTFMIVGGGCRLDELKKFASKINVVKPLIFTGFVPHQEIPYFIASASVCVACFENNHITRCKSPLKLAEYLAAGKPIVASSVGEVRNMVGGAGLLVEAGNSKTLADGIIKILNNPHLAKKMGALARRRAEEKYNWEETTENILSLYQKIIKGGGNDV